jgi:hypothetical protein
VQYVNAATGTPGVIGGPLPPNFGDQAPQFGADIGSAPAYIDDLAYRLMLICFLGTFDANIDALRWLTALMVRGGPNRQLTISRFLALATFGRIGDQADVPPDYGTVLRWAAEASAPLSLENALPQMVTQYISRTLGGGIQNARSSH